MDVNVTTQSLTRSIAAVEIRALLGELLESFCEQATALVEGFSATPPTPRKTNDLENRLFDDLRELGLSHGKVQRRLEMLAEGGGDGRRRRVGRPLGFW